MAKLTPPYVEIIDPTGRTVEVRLDGCARYSTAEELDMIERGYTIKVHGRKLTKKELKK